MSGIREMEMEEKQSTYIVLIEGETAEKQG